jgi:hypothetical protein
MWLINFFMDWMSSAVCNIEFSQHRIQMSENSVEIPGHSKIRQTHIRVDPAMISAHFAVVVRGFEADQLPISFARIFGTCSSPLIIALWPRILSRAWQTPVLSYSLSALPIRCLLSTPPTSTLQERTLLHEHQKYYGTRSSPLIIL